MSRVGRSASMSASSIPQSNSGPRILKEGSISLKGFLGFARQRYVSLTPSELLIYENRGEEAKTRIELSHATVKPDKDNHLFLVESGAEKLAFKCATPEERQSWLRVISDTIDHAKAQYQQQVFNQLQQLQSGAPRGATTVQPTPLTASSTQATYQSAPPPSSSSSNPSASASSSSSSSSSGSTTRNTTLTTSSTGSRKPARQTQNPTPTASNPSQPPQAVQPQVARTHYNLQYPSTSASTPLPPLPSTPQATSTTTPAPMPPANSSSSSSTSSSTQVRPLINNNPHGAVFPESHAYPSSSSSSSSMTQTAVFDASVLALMPEVRELFQPVQRWQPPVPDSLKLRIERDPKLESYIEKYKELYPELSSDSTFIFPDQENVCQQMSQSGSGGRTNTPGSGAQRGGTTASDIRSAAAAGYPGAYQAAAPQQARQPIGVGQRRRGASVAPTPAPYYYNQPYSPQPMAPRQPTTYVSYSRY